MGRRASRAGDPDGLFNVTVRVRGSVKNRWLLEAERRGVCLSDLVLLAVEGVVRSGEGVPRLVDGVRGSDVGDVLRGYVLGERVLEPCGRVSPCGRVEVCVGSFTFCDSCGVRVG